MNRPRNVIIGNWTGPIAFVLALGISVALATSLIVIALHPVPLDGPLESVLTTLAGAAVGAVATYLGTRGRKSGGTPSDPDPGSQ
jgi:hypothetical protein